MAKPKMPPGDEKALEKMKKLFQEGLEEAEKDPDKYMHEKRQLTQKIKPWKDYLKGWEKDWKKKRKTAVDSAVASRVVSRFKEG